MSTKAETKKEVLINLRITKEMADYLRLMEINISDTCREALQKELDKVLKVKGKK